MLTLCFPGDGFIIITITWEASLLHPTLLFFSSSLLLATFNVLPDEEKLATLTLGVKFWNFFLVSLFIHPFFLNIVEVDEVQYIIMNNRDFLFHWKKKFPPNFLLSSFNPEYNQSLSGHEKVSTFKFHGKPPTENFFYFPHLVSKIQRGLQSHNNNFTISSSVVSF